MLAGSGQVGEALPKVQAQPDSWMLRRFTLPISASSLGDFLSPERIWRTRYYLEHRPSRLVRLIGLNIRLSRHHYFAIHLKV
jgi:hypothetical protein